MNIYPIRENFAPTHLSVRCLIKHAPSGVHSSVARAKSGSILKILAANSTPPALLRFLAVFWQYLKYLAVLYISCHLGSIWQYLDVKFRDNPIMGTSPWGAGIMNPNMQATGKIIN